MDELTRLLRKDPDAALSALLKAYGGLVTYVVRGILPSFPQEDIEECVADAFLSIYRHRHRLDFSEGSIKAYLCTAAKNRAYDLLRKQQREQNKPILQEFDSVPSAEETVLQQADRDALIDAILDLGEPDARILICRYYLRLRSAEIGALVGLKENTVDQRARRALQKLAKQFQKGDCHEF